MKKYLYLITFFLLNNFTNQFALIRPFSDLNHIGVIFDNFYSLNMLGITKFKGKIDYNIFVQALEIIQKRHPFLQSRIITEPYTCFSTENVPDIPLEIVTRINDSQWQEIATKELQNNLPLAKGPLLRIIYLAGEQKGEIIWTYNHIISDSTSHVQLSAELFEIIQNIKENKKINLTQDNSWDAYHSTIISSEKPPLITRNYNLEPREKNLNIKNCFIPYIFSEEETANIKQGYRKHNCSLQSILMASLAQTIAQRINIKTGIEKPTITCHHPINARKRFNPALKDSDVGCWITTLNQEFKINSQENIWDLAYLIKNDLYEGIKNNKDFGSADFLIPFLNSSIPDYEILKKWQSDKPTAVVSQVGTPNIKTDYNDLFIDSMHFLFNWSGFLLHEDTFIITGSIINNRLAITFIYNHPSMAYEDANEMANDIIKKIMLACH